MPKPPSSAEGTPKAEAASACQQEANISTVEAIRAAAHSANTLRLLKKGPIWRASSVQPRAVATIVQSNRSRTGTLEAGKPTNEPTKTISIQARYTPSPKKATGTHSADHGTRRPLWRPASSPSRSISTAASSLATDPRSALTANPPSL